MKPVRSIGILGAGKLGIVLSQLALGAGYTVHIAGSGNPAKITLSVGVLAPGAVAMTAAELARSSDVVILALPLSKFHNLPKDELAGKLVIDAMNYWWEIDGPLEDVIPQGQTSSETVQSFLSASRVIKALNHMGYHDLHDETRPNGAAGRKAIAIAGNNRDDVEVSVSIIDSLGFDGVYIGNLASGKRLEPGGRVFGANVTKDELHKMLQTY